MKMNTLPFENNHVKFEFLGDVLKGTFKEGPVTLEVAKMIVDERRKFCNYKDFPLMITDLGLKSIKKDARVFLSTDEAIKGLTASALVSNSALGKHLANFFVNITVIRPKIPTKVFTSEIEAKKWLEKYVIEKTK